MTTENKKYESEERDGDRNEAADTIEDDACRFDAADAGECGTDACCCCC
jgi:hypothetical protein